MIRRLLCACMGAALVGALVVPTHVVAKPPDLPEDGTFTLTPDLTPPTPFVRRQPTPRPPLASHLPFGNPLNFIAFPWFDGSATGLHDWLSFIQQLNGPSDRPQPESNGDVLKDLPRPIGKTVILRGNGWGLIDLEEKVIYDAMPRPAVEAPPTKDRTVDNYISFYDETSHPAIEVLPMPHEVSDVTCPYLRQKISDSQACKSVDQLMGRDVSDNLNRLKQADKLLAKAKDLARDGFFAEALFCCVEAAELVPGSPCEQRAVDTMIKIACSYLPERDTIVTQKGESEESDEPPTDSDYPNVEVGIGSGGGLIMRADYSLSGKVYHLRYKQGSFSIWSTTDGSKTKP